MRVYRGYRRFVGAKRHRNERGQVHVVVDLGDVVEQLETRVASGAEFPLQFEWGYGGAGPRDLSYALIADACGFVAAQRPVVQLFKRIVTAKLPFDGWQMTSEEVQDWVSDITGQLDKDGVPDVFPEFPEQGER